MEDKTDSEKFIQNSHEYIVHLKIISLDAY